MYNELDQNFVLFGAVTAGHDGGSARSGENLPRAGEVLCRTLAR